jgi:hypothetical protein
MNCLVRGTVLPELYNAAVSQSLMIPYWGHCVEWISTEQACCSCHFGCPNHQIHYSGKSGISLAALSLRQNAVAMVAKANNT